MKYRIAFISNTGGGITHLEKEFPDEHWDTCTRCGELKPGKVRERYSFGIYAGRLCDDCCYTYRDNCGLDQPQGNPYSDLDEQIDDENGFSKVKAIAYLFMAWAVFFFGYGILFYLWGK